MTRFALAALVTVIIYQSGHAQTPAWQQRVHYEMDVQLDAERHALLGTQRLTYVNNSPDTLRKVYYHLYFNAFNPRSMMAERNRHLPDPDRRIVPRIFRLGPDEIGFHRIEFLMQDGRSVDFDVEDTVMEVTLAEPIAPGASTTFEMAFESQIPLQTRRSGRDNREGIDYSMSQWYPKMAAYDHRGWHAAPYVGREFYAPFGTFDVRLTLPSRYVVGATGVLQNPEEIGHGYWEEPVDHAGRDSLTWHFVAESVHDFAWAADPDYVHDRFPGPHGTTLHLLYLPEVADTWIRLREWLPQMVAFLSERFGEYPYPQFTVAQAGDGGMEYPMMTFVTGRRTPRSLAGVTGHELAHMWYYGVLATNETRHSWIDEGFTVFASTELSNHLFGRGAPANHVGSHLNMLMMHHQGIAEPIDLPADWYETNRAFGITAYSGGAMLVDMLGYVISDELRDRFLLELFERYKFGHPHPEDIMRVAEDVSGLELDWFFDQWLHTTRKLDYRITGLRSRLTPEGWETTVNLRRHGEIFMPVDVLLFMEDGSHLWVNVPLTLMQGHKPVPAGWQVAEPWAWTSPEYRLTVRTHERVRRAIIDPLGRTPDWNRLGNTSGALPMTARFLEPSPRDYFRYGIGLRPGLDYWHRHGVGISLQARGGYIFDRHLTKLMLKVRPGLDDPRAGVDRFVEYEVGYETPLYAMHPLARLDVGLYRHLGVGENRLRITYPLGRHPAVGTSSQTISAGLTHQYRRLDVPFEGAPAPMHFVGGTDEDPALAVTVPWGHDRLVYATLSWQWRDGDDRLGITVDAGGPWQAGAAASANRVVMLGQKSTTVGNLSGWLRVTAGFGPRQLAPQRQFRLGTVPLENQIRNAAVRNVAALMADPTGDVNFAALAPIGPVGYVKARRAYPPQPPWAAPGVPPLNLWLISTSNILAANFSVSVPPVTRPAWMRAFTVESFAGTGIAWNTDVDFDTHTVIADAGFALNLDVPRIPAIRRWTAQSDFLKDLNVTARFPLWLSQPELVTPGDPPLKLRWLIGINTDL